MPASDLERFLGYARAFELAYLSDVWSGVEATLADDARHVVTAAPPLCHDDRGRDGVVAGLRRSVSLLDRRFDVRIPEVLDGPSTRPDGPGGRAVWMRYALRLRRGGLPELRIEGEHLVRMRDGMISAIEELIEPGAGERVAEYLARHDRALRPAGTPFALPLDPRDAREAEAAQLRTLARLYGAAKSEQDAASALSVCSEDFALETVALGLASRDRKEAEQQIGLFFRVFPDYHASLDGLATAPGVVTAWGRIRGTWRGELLGFAPSGRAFDLPFVSIFPAANGSLTGERFHFDLATLCDQIALPLEALRERIALLGGTPTAPGLAGTTRSLEGAP